jgi:hypothetical protein
VTTPLARVVAIATLGLLVVAAALRAASRPHPLVVVDTFDGVAVAEGRWRWFGAAGPLVRNGRLILESDPPRSAYLDARFLDQSPPTGAAQAERVDLTAAVRRAGTFLVLVEAWFDRTLLWIQLTAYGAHVTYPGSQGERTGYELHDSALADPTPHRWRIERDARTVAIEFDGRRIWSAPARGQLARLRLGDVGSDEEHRGTIEVDAFRYERVGSERA